MRSSSKSFVFGVAVGIAVYYAYAQTRATQN